MHWEYKTIKIAAAISFWTVDIDEKKLEQVINDLGADGWELVSALSVTHGYGSTKNILAIFKRRKN